MFGIKPRDWQKTLERNLIRGVRPEGTSLAIAGYPELHSVTFFLTHQAAERWRETGSLEEPSGLSGVWNSVLTKHGNWENRAPFVTIIGRYPQVLAAIRDHNSKGDVTPPWVLFPEHDSYSGFWRQGGEFWIAEQFRPFWSMLGETGRQVYLDRWDAPPDWREFVGQFHP